MPLHRRSHPIQQHAEDDPGLDIGPPVDASVPTPTPTTQRNPAYTTSDYPRALPQRPATRTMLGDTGRRAHPHANSAAARLRHGRITRPTAVPIRRVDGRTGGRNHPRRNRTMTTVRHFTASAIVLD